MPLHIIHQDITTVRCDALVDPTDPEFSGRGGTDLAIHRAAGDALRRECDRLPALPVGGVAVTGGYGLPCRNIIHTVGPVWKGGNDNEAVLLRSCYLNVLLKADELGAGSVALPLISAGTFGFPKKEVMSIALSAISDCLRLAETEPDIYLCVYDRESYEISEEQALNRWLRRNSFDGAVYASRPVGYESASPKAAVPKASAHRRPAPKSAPPKAEAQNIGAPSAAWEEDGLSCAPCAEYADDALSLEDWIRRHDDSFAVTLMKLIDRKGMTDVQCYKKANVSKGTFWKINNDPKYKPAKTTVLAFAIALELSLSETEQLLRTVGFSLSHSSTFDLIIEFYISRGIYDIFEINAALYRYDQLCLGC